MNQQPIISTHRGRQVVLGRKRVSPHVLGIARVKATELLDSFPAAADARDWIQAAANQCNGNFGVMHNDTLGCCTIADGPGHNTQIWTANNGPMVTPPDSAILAAYETVDGYNPADPSTDQGGVEADVVAAWQRGIDGFAKLDLYVTIAPTNLEHIFTGIERYGVVYAGVALPLSAQDEAVWQLDMTDPAKADPNSWGGHAISWSKYNRIQKRLGCITWGMEQEASLDWQGAYCDEARALLCSTLWCPNGKSPLGDLVATLSAGIAGLAS